MEDRLESLRASSRPNLLKGACIRKGDCALVIDERNGQVHRLEIAKLDDRGAELVGATITPLGSNRKRAQSIAAAYRRALAPDDASFESLIPMIDAHGRKPGHVHVTVRVPGADSVELSNLLAERRRPFRVSRTSVSSRDALTGLPTRAILEDDRALAEWLRSISGPVDILLFDVRGVGLANSFGLRQQVDAFFAVLHAAARATLGDSSFGVRYGGDEFLYIVPPDKQLEFAQRWEAFRTTTGLLAGDLLPATSEAVGAALRATSLHSATRQLWADFVASRDCGDSAVRNMSSVIQDFADSLRQRLGDSAPTSDDIGELSLQLVCSEQGVCVEPKYPGLLGLTGVRTTLSAVPQPAQLRAIAHSMALSLGTAKMSGDLVLDCSEVGMGNVQATERRDRSARREGDEPRRAPVTYSSIVTAAQQQSEALRDRVQQASDVAVDHGVLRYEVVRSFPVGLFTAQVGPWHGTSLDIPWFGLLNNHVGHDIADQLLNAASRFLRNHDPASVLVRLNGGTLLWLHREPLNDDDSISLMAQIKLPLQMILTSAPPELEVAYKQKRAVKGLGSGKVAAPAQLGDVLIRPHRGALTSNMLFSAVAEQLGAV